MKVKESENIQTEESNGIKEQAATPTALEPKEFQEILAALDPFIFGPYALFTKTKAFVMALTDTPFRD